MGGGPVTLEDFGATGGNAVADGAALVSAIAYTNAAGGGTIRGQPGRAYHIHKLGGSGPISVTSPLVFDLNGATLKRPDAVVDGNNQRGVYLSVANGASLEVHGGSLDANYRQNPRPEGSDGFVWQQNTFFYVVTAANAAVPFIKFHDLVLKDREIFDHIRVSPGAGSRVDLLHIDNVQSQAPSIYSRGDIIWYRGIKSVIVENCPYLHAVETEFTTAEDDMLTEVVIRDSDFGRLDLLFKGTSENKQCDLERVTVAGRIGALMGAKFRSEDCVFVLGSSGGAYVRPPSWDAINTEVHVPATGWNMAALNNSEPSHCTFSGCTVKLAAGEPTPAPGTRAIYFPQVAASTINKHDLTFQDCTFDCESFDGIGDPTGKVALLRNNYACKGDWALYMAAGSREQQLTVENAPGGFACEATYSLYFNNWDEATDSDYLEISGQWDADVEKPVTWVGGTPNDLFEFRDLRTSP